MTDPKSPAQLMIEATCALHYDVGFDAGKAEVEAKIAHILSVVDTTVWCLEVSKRPGRKSFVDVNSALQDLISSWNLYKTLHIPDKKIP